MRGQSEADGTIKTPRWNFLPDLPLQSTPFYERPTRPLAVLGYMVASWSPFRVRFWFFAIACGIWWFTSPSLEQTGALHASWILQIWVRNLIIFSIVAGGLHLWLYTFRRQGDELRYDSRPYPVRRSGFLFGHQLWDNVFWSLTTGVLVWTGYEVGFMWAYASGVAPSISFDDNPLWFIVLIFLTPYWAGFYFYAQHRILHWPPLYRTVHIRHHRNVNQGPWSGLSQHPVEQIVDQSDCLIFLFVPSHPLHMIFMLMHHAIGAPTSHTGYHALRLRGGRSFVFGAFFHQLHHRWFDCNYGTDDTPWDQIFGSFHDGTAEGHRRITERRRALAARARQR
jgi:lathosterol oxidase